MYNKRDDTFALVWAKKIRAISLMGGKCKKCGTDDIYVLEFHHIDGRKDFELGSGENRLLMWEVIEKEIGRCELLCSNCHSETHYTEGRGAIEKDNVLKQIGIHKCSKCGYKGLNLNSLCFHHINPNDKKFNVSNFFARKEMVSVADLFKEIAKCNIICRNCHKREHTAFRRLKKMENLIKYKIGHHKSRPRIDEDTVRYFKKQGKGLCEIARILGKNKSSIFYVFHRV